MDTHDFLFLDESISFSFLIVDRGLLASLWCRCFPCIHELSVLAHDQVDSLPCFFRKSGQGGGGGRRRKTTPAPKGCENEKHP